MKKLLFIALMSSFLVGNAQHEGQQPGSGNSPEQIQIYADHNPWYPIAFDLNKLKNRIPDYNPGFPAEVDINKNKNRMTDNFTRHPAAIDVNKDRNRITDDLPWYPVTTYQQKNKNRSAY